MVDFVMDTFKTMNKLRVDSNLNLKWILDFKSDFSMRGLSKISAVQQLTINV